MYPRAMNKEARMYSFTPLLLLCCLFVFDVNFWVSFPRIMLGVRRNSYWTLALITVTSLNVSAVLI